MDNSKSLPMSYLGIDKLVSVFNSTTASYKFYWLISIVELLENGKIVIPKKSIYARMISNSWFTINYFQVSFGKADQLQDLVKVLKDVEPSLNLESSKEHVFQVLANTPNKTTTQLLNKLGSNVPHWFLSTWFPKSNKKDIVNRSQYFENDCLYALESDEI